MATALQHITECCVCRNEFTDPRVLPCDHTFCQTCIDHIKKGSRIKCPVCNEIHDVNRIKPDFKLTQFIDALKEKERTPGLSAGEGAVCDLCSEESATHWCEECKQWLGKTCAKMHSKIPAVQYHQSRSISVKCRQVKDEFTEEARSIKEVIDQYSRSIRNLQDEINKLEITQADALAKSDEIKNKAVQAIKNVFNTVDAEIIAFIHDKTESLEAKRKELTKELDGIESKWKQLEEMIEENSNTIAIEGSAIIDQVKRFQRAMGELNIQMDPVFITVSSGKDWNPETLVKAQITGGNISSTNASLNRAALPETIGGSSSVDLSGLCINTFELKNNSRLKNQPFALRLINNQLWVCEEKGVIEVFDMNFKRKKKIKNRAWETVWDVAMMSNDALVVATGNGLYHITLDGKQTCQIESGYYTGAVVYNSKLYAMQLRMCSGEVNIYTYNGTWKTEGSVRLPCSGTLTLNVNKDAIFACHLEGKKVYKLSHTGHVLQSIGSSELWSRDYLLQPFLCQADNDGRFLVADSGTYRLQVLDRDSTWRHVRMEPPVGSPNGAVYVAGQLYVVSQSNKGLYEYVQK